MTSTLLTLTLAVLLAGDATPGKKVREPNPFAPSLPLLTDEEEAQLDEIIDRFIQFDTGEAVGTEARKARDAFDRLGPEAIPALIRGLNRAALVDYSCPAVTIAKKLGRMLESSDDAELLQFARENIGAGVTQSRHMGVLKDLKVACMLRQNLVARKTAAAKATGGSGSGKSLKEMKTSDLAAAAGSERGERLKPVLLELEQRGGDEAIAALGAAAAASASEPDMQKLARDLLVSNLTRQGLGVVKDKLKDDRAEVRAAAAQVAGGKGLLALGGGLIDLLDDDEARVRDAAHAALVRLNHGSDLGPDRGAGDTERAAAVKKWREWWTKQGGR
jgi:hypothetical protein